MEYKIFYLYSGMAEGGCKPGGRQFLCRNIKEALLTYHNLANQTWIFNVWFILASSQKLYDLNGTGLTGFGNPNTQESKHVHINFTVLKPEIKVNISLANISFQHVIVDIQDIPLNIENCTQEDSAFVVNFAAEKGKSLSITNSRWKDIYNLSALDVSNADKVNLKNNNITNVHLVSTKEDKRLNVIHLKNINHVSIKSLTVFNTSHMPEAIVNKYSNSTNISQQIKEAKNNYPSVVKISNSASVVLDSMRASHTNGSSVIMLYNVTDCKISDGNFSDSFNNDPYCGGAIVSLTSNLSLNISEFQYNGAGSGGSICAVSDDKSFLSVTSSNFHENSADHDGGAIFSHGVDTIIKRCTFSQNTGDLGGSVHIRGTFVKKYSLTMQGVNFYNNFARFGGSVYTYRSSASMQDIEMLLANTVDNVHGFTPTLSLHVVNLKMKKIPGHEVFIHLSDLHASNLTLDIQSWDLLNSFTFIFQAIIARESHDTISLSNYTLICPQGFTLLTGLVNGSLQCSAGECTLNYDYEPACVLRPPYRYLVRREKFSITDHGNGSQATPYQVKDNLMMCPNPGGNCTFGCPSPNEPCSVTVRPLPGYVGQIINNTVQFVQCPAGYCCWGPDCLEIESCHRENLRTGIVCSQCPHNHTVAVFSAKCVENKKCNNIWPIPTTIGLTFFFVILFTVLGIPDKAPLLLSVVKAINQRPHISSTFSKQGEFCHRGVIRTSVNNTEGQEWTSVNNTESQEILDQNPNRNGDNAETTQNSLTNHANEIVRNPDQSDNQTCDGTARTKGAEHKYDSKSEPSRAAAGSSHNNENEDSYATSSQSESNPCGNQISEETDNIYNVDKNEDTEIHAAHEANCNGHDRMEDRADSRNSREHTGNFLQCVLTISFYIQDVTLYHSHLIDYIQGNDGWVQSLTNAIPFIRDIINFHAGIMRVIDEHTCIYPGMSPVAKEVIKTMVYPLSMLVFGFLYVVVFVIIPAGTKYRLFRWLGFQWFNRKLNNEKMKISLAVGFLICVSLSYQQITLTLLNLVNCVDIYDQRKMAMIHALRLDANIECYTGWQTCVTFIIFLNSISLPFYYIFAPGKLNTRQISTTTFLAGFVIPGVFLGWWLLQFPFKRVRCLRSVHKKLCHQLRRLPYVRRLIRKPGYINLDAPRSSPVRDALLDYIQGPYKTSFDGRFNWSGIIQLLRMALIFSSVLIDAPWERIMFMWTVSLTSLALHGKFEPLKSQGMNLLAFLCQIAIVFVGNLYLYLSSLEDEQIPPLRHTDRLTALYAVIDVFSVIFPGVCYALITLCAVISGVRWVKGQCQRR